MKMLFDTVSTCAMIVVETVIKILCTAHVEFSVFCKNYENLVIRHIRKIARSSC
jgi:hypothetical protein